MTHNSTPAHAIPEPVTPGRILLLQVLIASVYYPFMVMFGNKAMLYRNDDAFYYFTVARNWARIGIWSFDGINATSGVQPLWAGVLSVVAWGYHQLGGDLYGDGLVRVFMLIACGLHILSAVLLYRLVRVIVPQRRSLPLVIAALWLFTPGLALNQTAGLESPLYACLLMLTLHHAYRLRPTYTSHAGLGALLGLLTLARIDAALWGAVLGALLVWRAWRTGTFSTSLPRLLTVALVVLAVVVPYLLLNYQAQGHIMPISGTVKDYRTTADRADLGGWFGLSHLRFLAQNVADAIGLMLFYGVYSLLIQAVRDVVLYRLHIQIALPLTTIFTATSATAMVVWIRGKRKSGTPVWPWSKIARLAWREQLLASFGVFCVAHFVIIALLSTPFLKYSGASWYFVPQTLCLVVGIGVVWDQVITHPALRTVRRTASVLIAANLLIVTALMVQPTGPTFSRAARVDLARWSNTHLPAEARIGSFNSGQIGYFSKHPVFNLDGLANNYDYLNHYYKTDQLCAYLDRYGITHIIEYAYGDPALYDMLETTLHTVAEDATIVRRVVMEYPVGMIYYVVERGPCQSTEAAAKRAP